MGKSSVENFLIPDHGKLWHKWPSFLGSCNRTNKPILVPIIAKTILDKLNYWTNKCTFTFIMDDYVKKNVEKIILKKKKMSQRKNFLWQSSNGYLPHILAAHNIFLLPHQYFASNILTNIWYRHNILAAHNIFLLLHKDCAGNISPIFWLSTMPTSLFLLLPQYLQLSPNIYLIFVCPQHLSTVTSIFNSDLWKLRMNFETDAEAGKLVYRQTGGALVWQIQSA